MAEVPEVETIVRDLRSAVVGRTILEVEVIQPEAVRFPAPAAFVELLTGQQILGAERRAKYILLPLTGDLLLAIHFMLWGTLLLTPKTAPSHRHADRVDAGSRRRAVAARHVGLCPRRAGTTRRACRSPGSALART